MRCRTSPTRPTPRSPAGQGSFADLIPRLAELTASLDRQTNDIIAAADGLNRFAGILARSKDSLGRTLDTLPGALTVLNDNRGQHRRRVRRAANASPTVASHILSETKDDFAADFKDLYPVIKAFNDNADDFIKDLRVPADLPVPLQVPAAARCAATTSTCSSPST